MDVKSFIKNTAEKEKQNHRIVNIMMIALFSLVIIFTLCFGVNVNIGSAVYDDGTEEYYVRQNLFQVVDVVFSTTMTKEDAEYYVSQVNAELIEKYGVLGINTEVLKGEGEIDQGAAFDNLKNFGIIAKELGKDASKINFLKYKLAYAIAIGDVTNQAHIQSYAGSRVFAISGQLILIMLAQLALIAISLVFLVLGIISLVKKKQNRAKFSLILLLICCFLNIVLFSSMSFMAMNWAGYLVMVLVFLCTVCYALIKHAMMDRSDFSWSMLIHNGALLLGGIIALSLFLSPIFKMTSANGNVINLGWSYIMDYSLTENAYMQAVMAYTLTEVLMMALLMMPSILLIIMILTTVGKFLSADYQHNEKRIFLIISTVVTFIIGLILMVPSFRGGLNITSQYAEVKMNLGYIITQLVLLAGLIAFEYLYKVKPIKKELFK